MGVSKPSLRAKASRQDVAGTSRKHMMPMKKEQEREYGQAKKGLLQAGAFSL